MNTPQKSSNQDAASRAKAAKVKGRAFTAVLSALDALEGARAVRVSLARARPELALLFEQRRFDKDAWYAIDWYRALLAAITQGNQHPDELMRAIGAECARQDLSGAYRLLARLLRPQTLFAGAMRFFKNYYDTGEVWVVTSGSGHAQAIWKECHGFDRNMWLEVVGSAEAILALGGARQLELNVSAGGLDGDAHMELRARWKLR